MSLLTAAAIFAVVVNFGPEALSKAGLGTQGAWEYVTHGFEAAALWTVMFLARRNLYERLVYAWCIFEAVQRSVCRLAFPMDVKPKLQEGQSLCEAAYGVPASAVSVVCALALVALVQEVQRATKPQ